MIKLQKETRWAHIVGAIPPILCLVAGMFSMAVNAIPPEIGVLGFWSVLFVGAVAVVVLHNWKLEYQIPKSLRSHSS